MGILGCFVCAKSLEPVITDQSNLGDQPYEATIFISHGNYGSTVFDPPTNGILLRINICDPCLLARAEANLVLIDMIAPRAAIHDYSYWDGELD